MRTLQLLAFDLGASSGRAILGRYDGERLSLEEVHKFPNGGDSVNGHLYWNVLRLFHEIKVGLKKAQDATGKLDSLGIDTWGVDYGLLDKNDELLSNPYHYRDSRTNGLLEKIVEIVPQEEIYGVTGIQFMPFNTLVQLYADVLYRPWILEGARALLFMPDLLNFFLTGKKGNEYTIASTSQFLEAKSGQWAISLLERLGIKSSLLGEIVFPGTVLGSVLPQVADECGLTGEVTVVAVGSHDTASAVAATPMEDTDRSAYLSSGTWSLLGMELDTPMITDRSLAANFTNEGGVGGKIRFLKNISGLWLIQQCRKSWQRQGMNLSFDDIALKAAKAEPMKFRLDPDDPVFLSPPDMPTAILEYCAATGQAKPENIGEMARGIYESLAFSYRDTLETLEEVTGKRIETVNVVGGGTQAQLLCQLTADITGRRVVAGPVEATAMGNLLVQLMAKGEIKNLDEARELVKRSVELVEYVPLHEG